MKRLSALFASVLLVLAGALALSASHSVLAVALAGAAQGDSAPGASRGEGATLIPFDCNGTDASQHHLGR